MFAGNLKPRTDGGDVSAVDGRQVVADFIKNILHRAEVVLEQVFAPSGAVADVGDFVGPILR